MTITDVCCLFGRWGTMVQRSILVACLIVILCTHVHLVVAADKSKCDTCKDIVKNVNKGIKKTSKSNFGGGNTNWEEEKLGSYIFSETRLVEILESACADSSKECHSMVEEHEELIEKWWFKLYAKGKHKDLHSFLCIRELEVCCPNGTYGPDCLECMGGKQRPCKNNGKCIGDGTREGNGQCDCQTGYRGQLCDECKDKFYEESKNDTQTVCKACDKACKSSCWEGGPQGCDDCKGGWVYVEDEGCTDKDECEADSPCEEEQYCTNTPGSYRCSDCDKSCDGCTGPGPTKCTECADRFYEHGGICKACHAACESSCTDDTPKTCDVCRDGWKLSNENQCIDIDECETRTADCEDDEYCTNTEGSFKCPSCHYACDGCTGPAANQCKQCNVGYAQSDDGYCKDVDECDAEGICTGDHAQCTNTPGSYKCGCVAGHEIKDGNCQEKPKEKKKKSKKKKKVKTKPKETSDDDSDEEKINFPPVPSSTEAQNDEDFITMEGAFNDLPHPSESDKEESQTHRTTQNNQEDNQGKSAPDKDKGRQEL